MFIIKTTNKFAMNKRQPDSGLRQYNCTGPGKVVGPTWPKVYKNTLITWRQLPKFLGNFRLQIAFTAGMLH